MNDLMRLKTELERRAKIRGGAIEEALDEIVDAIEAIYEPRQTGLLIHTYTRLSPSYVYITEGGGDECYLFDADTPEKGWVHGASFRSIDDGRWSLVSRAETEIFMAKHPIRS